MDEEVISKLLEWVNGNKASPDMIQIYPTNKCNLRCIFCCQQLQRYDLNDIVPKKRWLEIVEEICRSEVNRILISGGGEPMAEPELTLEMMQMVKDFKLEGRMITNGTLWSDECIRKTIEMGWDELVFSIDAPDARTHDFLRGVPGAFKKAIENVKKFQYWKKKYNFDKPRIEFTTVLTTYNYKKAPSMLKIAKRLGVIATSFEPVCINNPSVERMKLQKKEREYFLNSVVPEILRVSQDYKIFVNCDILKEVKEFEKAGHLEEKILENIKKQNANPFLSLPCYEAWLWPKIEANGDVWPCSTAPLSTNIKNNSFKEIWFGEEFADFRKKMIDGNLSDSCGNCVLTHLPINNRIREKLKEHLAKS